MKVITEDRMRRWDGRRKGRQEGKVGKENGKEHEHRMKKYAKLNES